MREKLPILLFGILITMLGTLVVLGWQHGVLLSPFKEFALFKQDRLLEKNKLPIAQNFGYDLNRELSQIAGIRNPVIIQKETLQQLVPPLKANAGAQTTGQTSKQYVEIGKLEQLDTFIQLSTLTPLVSATPVPIAPPHQDTTQTTSPSARALQSAIPGLWQAKDHYSLSNWVEDKQIAGSLISLLLKQNPAKSLSKYKIKNDDELIFEGWAGHLKLGTRMAAVIFTLCDKVIGQTAVNLPTPDIATQVHNNLDYAGWRTSLAAALLPRCEEARLQAWGVGYLGNTIWRLAGSKILKFAENKQSNPASLNTLETASLLRPEDQPPLTLVRVTVPIGGLNLRNCPKIDCVITSNLANGLLDIRVFDTRDNWLLVQFEETAGWLQRELLVDTTNAS